MVTAALSCAVNAVATRLNSVDIPQFLRMIPVIHKQQHSDGRVAIMSDKKQTVDLGLLEEDDEFEEFPAEGK